MYSCKAFPNPSILLQPQQNTLPEHSQRLQVIRSELKMTFLVKLQVGPHELL